MTPSEKEPVLPSYHEATKQNDKTVLEETPRATCQIMLKLIVEYLVPNCQKKGHKAPVALPLDATFLEYQLAVQNLCLYSSHLGEGNHSFEWSSFYHYTNDERTHTILDRENWTTVLDDISKKREATRMCVKITVRRRSFCRLEEELQKSLQNRRVNERVKLLQGRYFPEPRVEQPPPGRDTDNKSYMNRLGKAVERSFGQQRASQSAESLSVNLWLSDRQIG